ncbi:MAG: dihydroorotase family protein, partial [Candidatus Bathyarchaeia archaeon]
MSADLLLKNCRFLYGDSLFDGCIGVRSGKICYLGKEASAPPASEIQGLSGNIVLPGLCDVHTHLRDLSQSYKEDFYTGTCSALAGGFTTLLDMPIPSAPSESLRQLQDKISSASSKAVVNVGFHSGLPETSEELYTIKKIGAFGLKIYMNRRENLDGGDYRAVEQAMVKAHKVGLPAVVHAEDLVTIERLEKVYKNSDLGSFEAFLRTRPPRTEADAVARVLDMVRKIGTRTHFCHLSVQRSIELLRSAKTEGLPVSCEATPHHLFLTSKAMYIFGGKSLVAPPLRSQVQRRALWQGLHEGVIDVVASDHAPHTIAEKRTGDIWQIPPGIPGLETTLPLLLTAWKRGKLTLRQIQKLLAERPCRLFGIMSKGLLEVGKDADLVVVDINRSFIVNPESFHSKAKHSPFQGWKLFGKVVKVFLKGN